MDISEKNLEDTIESALLAAAPIGKPGIKGEFGDLRVDYSGGSYPAGGYLKRTQDDYDKTLCMLKSDALNFISATQAKEWRQLVGQYGGDQKKAEEQFFERLAKELYERGTPDVMRKGIKTRGCHFALAYYRPSSRLNPDAEKLYRANIFSVVRQLHYSQRNNKSLDIATFLNGLPIFTAELKNQFTGQSAEKNAIDQYKDDRDSIEPLFAFGRCLAHFAIDPDEVFMTTHLQGRATNFIPFNQGNQGGKGNPPSDTGFATAYLWERIWSRDSVLNLLQHFVHILAEKKVKSKKAVQGALLFPRYHQLDAVRRILADTLLRGSGQHYLIEHSAGSGKSNTLSWLAYQLSLLHDEDDKRIFDSIIVITDRRILDRQLQQTIQQFEPTQGILENIDKTSKQLKKALEDGITIIVTTLQKFPVIVKDMQALKGKRFAVIIDEAHSSQTGSSSESMKSVLAKGNLDDTEENAEQEDTEDRVEKVVKAHGPLPHVSYFAFTATPKDKTLRLFGTPRPDGGYDPFSLYSMRQAIEEGYILDVLQNYVTYQAYWNLQKKAEEDPHYDRAKAAQQILSYVESHTLAVEKKIAIIAEHFKTHTAQRIKGKAKAMIVARSRKQAVRYKLALDKYLQEHGYTYKTLVAFSGTVHDGIDYSESNMNGFPESQTAETFKQDAYRFLIVADKFQTGFAQPLLHTMYVDKKLAGVHAVQTLSRLNRTHPDKEETMVLDFVNEAEDIRKAFAPYYEKTSLASGTDPDLLYDLQTRLANFQFYTEAEIDNFAAVYFHDGPQYKLHAILTPVVDRFKAATPEEQIDFRGQLHQYIDLYSFLSQVVTFADHGLEQFYRFVQLLRKKLPLANGRLPIDAYKYVDLKSYELEEKSGGRIALLHEADAGELATAGIRDVFLAPIEEREPVSQIIEELNYHFGASLTEEDKNQIHNLEEQLSANSRIESAVRVNSVSNARLTFDEEVNDMLQDMMLNNLDSLTALFTNFSSNEDFKKRLLDFLFERYLERTKQSPV